MPSTIVQRIIGGLPDTRISLSNSNFARGHGLNLWTTLRVGIRFIINDSGANITSTPRLAVGLCSGVSDIFLDALTTHFAGVLTSNASWTRNAGAPGYYDAGNVLQLGTRIGAAITTSSTAGSTFQIIFPATGANRMMLFFDLTRGAPYQAAVFGPNSAAANVDVPAADFLTQMALTTPSYAGHAYGGPVTFAVDEVAHGTLDTINIAWNMPAPTLEICDVAVARLA